jgi:hypothetical protein
MEIDRCTRSRDEVDAVTYSSRCGDTEKAHLSNDAIHTPHFIDRVPLTQRALEQLHRSDVTLIAPR